ncbi:MAG TPA: tetratricopeptide repeat protein [Vicinamibacterales bacterium]|nr:tetratricopeptide repeat protein [Vicinamibacterales bacterium]
MDVDRWQRVKETFASALEQHPDLRPAFLDAACAGDPALREEVEALLRADAESGGFIEQPALLGLALDALAANERQEDGQESNIGRVLGSYSIEQCIGRGGMGSVYLARRIDLEFDRQVAIKMIRRGMDSELVIRRFRHERQILASLDHPHIASLFDGGTTPDGLPYFVMEYVAGIPIDRYADEHRLTIAARLQLCLGVLDAVQHAHDRHVVHRDLKPSNVLVTADGRPKLLDFGIAKLLDQEGMDGASTFTTLARPLTPDYASPEQVRGDPVTPATDVYAVGLLLYELLTGHRPHRLTTHTTEEMARVVCEQDPERPSAVVGRTETRALADGTTETRTPATVSQTREGSPDLLRRRLTGALDDIVMKALRKEPERRYPTAAALADDLRRHLAEQPVSAGRGALRYRTTRWARRHRAGLGAAAMVVAAIGIGALVARVSTRSAASAQDASVAARGQTAPRPSVAVLDFTSLSRRPSDEWLSTALAEMLTTELAGDGQVRVVPTDLVARAERDVLRGGPGDSGGGGPKAAAVEQMRVALAVDYLVMGTVAMTEQSPTRALRLDIRVHRVSGDPIAVSSVGDEAGIFNAIAGAGRELRAHLGLSESPPEATSRARAAFPRSLEATKLYAEATARLRVLDAVAARDLLEQAAAREPDSPLVQAGLASAWTALGFDGRAESAAQKAFDTSGALNREDRLNVEGRLYEAQRKWTKAVDVYHTLWGFFSDNIEYGLRLAGAQTAGGQAQDAIATVEAMRGAPAPQNQDARIDLAEAQAYSALANFARELAALERALQAASATGSKLLVARARLLEGRSYFSQGQPDRATPSLETARQMFLEAGDRAGAASALNSLGSVLADQQDISRAEQMYKESLATSEEIGDRRGMSAALNNLGILLKDERHYDEARQAHERSLTLRREIGDRDWIAVSLSNIGVVLFEQDRLREAATYYDQSLAIAREIGDKRQQVRAQHNLAIVQRELGNMAAARAGLEESLATRAEIGDKRGGAIGRVELGMVLLDQGEIDAARKAEEEAVRLARETRLKPGEAQGLFQLGEIALATGDFKRAREQHERALALRREMGETRTIPESEVALAALAFEEGRASDAEREAMRLDQSLASEPGPLHISVDLILARAELARRDVGAADRWLGAARDLAKKTERIDVRRWLAMVEAEADAARGRTDEARRRLSELRTTLARSGMVLAELESRAALLQIDRAAGRSNVEMDTQALEKDATARHAGLILGRLRL